ncbi:MAG: Ig-like domain-containing protein, partial [Gemmatimonadales bacterium]
MKTLMAALRLAAAALIGALALHSGAHAQTLACNPSAPRTDPGVGFTPFGANEQLLARGGQSGPAWEWALGTDTEAGQKVQGSLDWVSGRSYAWTLVYSGSGSATLEVRDAGALVLSLNYPSGMDAGNALQLQVATNPSIGVDTTIAATTTSLNAQAAAGAVSQTGNNQESSQSLYWYYPPMAQGFTAQGTVSLTYATLPAGSRVDFRVRAGTLPCSNLAPTVSLSAPAAGSIHQAGSAIPVSANAQDTDGTIAQVEFLANGAPIGTDASSPYSIQWTGAAPGSYSLAARATDNAGDQTLSAAVAITVNAQPTVSITSPASGTVVQAPGAVTLTASASDSDGTVTRVDFYRDGILIGTDTSSPYEASVTGLTAGTYSFTAQGTVSLTYATLPAGSRVDFRVRAGTLPCSNLAPTV